ncbi:MAG TPA: ATP-grasp domain-containing protein [Streptosporangiaceae bacterium]|nr:ATP-grasp domain-containing protein [Streptosporangiaceae bacterium]
MQLLEHQGKRLLAEAGVAIPDGSVAAGPDQAEAIAARLTGRVVVKSQVPAGKRGKAGGVLFADSPAQAGQAARALLGSEVSGYTVSEVLVERAAPIASELYAAFLNDPASKGPLLLFSSAGGGDIEEVSAESPEKIHRVAVDIRTGLPPGRAEAMLTDAGIAEPARREVAAVLDRLYGLYRQIDADLVEVNPLAVTTDGRVVALDSKISIDAGAQARQPALREIVGDRVAADDTPLERSGRDLGMQFIELDGEVGVLANGAGLTMTTLDAINHYGGRPANFLEIGGDAYTKATPALRLVLANPKVRSLLVNFCGAFARTDVMTEGVVQAWEELKPDVPVFFSIHGTGEEEAIALVRERLGMEPYDLMDDAVRAAVEAAGTGTGTANVAASGVAR